MTDIRNYLTDKATSNDEPQNALADALLAMESAGLLDVTIDNDGAPLFALKEGTTDEQFEIAESIFTAMAELEGTDIIH
mgnify:FL=1